MSKRRIQCFTLLLCLALMLPSIAQAATRKKAAHRTLQRTTHSSGKHARKTAKKGARRRGQQAMDPQRVREIQSALIRERYMEGEPTGVWDQRSKTAMQRFQSVNGWQTKVVPDSRALIKLGLGPDRANLLNPDTAAVGIPGGGTATHGQNQQ